MVLRFLDELYCALRSWPCALRRSGIGVHVELGKIRRGDVETEAVPGLEQVCRGEEFDDDLQMHCHGPRDGDIALQRLGLEHQDVRPGRERLPCAPTSMRIGRLNCIRTPPVFNRSKPFPLRP